MLEILSINKRTGRVLIENLDTKKKHEFFMKDLKAVKCLDDSTIEMQDRSGICRQLKILD
jgi:hypothetical protein